MSLLFYVTLVEKTLHDDPRGNPRFRSWFGASKVVDENGKPLVLYHGTASDFSRFKRMVWGSVTPALANEYADLAAYDRKGGANVLPIYMRIINPFDADRLPSSVTVKEFFQEVMTQAGSGMQATAGQIENMFLDVRAAARREESGPHYSKHDFWYQSGDLFGRDGAALIMKLFDLGGFDGIRMHENGALTYGAFSPKQVKSVFNKAFNADTDHLSEGDAP